MECVRTLQRTSADKLKINILYTILVILYPLLSMYRFFGTRLSIADACAIFVIFLMLLKDCETFTFSRLFFFVAIYMFLHTCLVLLFYSSAEDYDTTDLLGTTLRLLLVYFVLSMAKRHFVFDFGKKFLIVISVIATIYMFIQLAFSFGGIYIGGGIPFLTKYAFREDVAGYVESVAKYGLNYRPRSFFEEPAHFCQYIVVAVVLLLFDKDKISHGEIITIVFLSLGVIFSMSLLGWTALFLVFLMWLFLVAKKKKYLKNVLIITLLVPIICTALWNTSLVQSVVVNKFLNQSVMSDARFSGTTTLGKIFSVGGVGLLLGKGLVATETYYNGVSRLIVSFGMLGLFVAFFLFVFFMNKHKNNTIAKVLLLLLFMLSFGSEIIFGKFILIYLVFLQIKAAKKTSMSL